MDQFVRLYSKLLTVVVCAYAPLVLQCANSLVTNGSSRPDGIGLRFECRTCTYVHKVVNRIERTITNLPKKAVDDVLGGESAWDLADATKTPCPKCGHPKAFFFQMQTRSADEPMTTFYRCAGCAHQWKEN